MAPPQLENSSEETAPADLVAETQAVGGAGEPSAEEAADLTDRSSPTNPNEATSARVETFSTTPLRVFFDFDSAEIQPEFQDPLRELAQELARVPGARASVVGYSDGAGSSIYNLTLSSRRAEAVAAYLESAGIDPTRLEVEGKGVNTAVAGPADGASPGVQRLVEVLVIPPAN